MSLLKAVKKRSSEGEDGTLSKSAKIYKLSKPEKKDITWECGVSRTNKIKKIPDPETFKSLDELSETLQDKIKLNTTKEKCKFKLFHITETFLHKCLMRCLDEEEFYTRSGLEYIIQNQLVTTTLHSILIDCAIKYKDLHLVKTVLQYCRISESLILKLIKHVFSTVSTEEAESICENINLETCPTSIDVLNYILVIMSFEMDLVKMRQQLKLLNTDEAVTFLQLLRYILLQVSPALRGDPLFDSTVLPEKMVVGWIDALISAQMMSFATSPSLKSLVEHISKTISIQVGFYDTIGTLVPYMDVLQKVYELPPRNIEKYSVEIIHL